MSSLLLFFVLLKFQEGKTGFKNEASLKNLN